MKQTFLFAVISLLLVACGASAVADTARAKSDYVVLILDNAPNMSHTDSLIGHGSTSLKTLQYVDSSLYTVDYQPSPGFDTLRLPTFGGFAQLRHLYYMLETQYYLLQAGDTVLITYNGEAGRPELRSLMSDSLTTLYNYYVNGVGRPRILGYSAAGITDVPSSVFKIRNTSKIDIDSLILEARAETLRFAETIGQASIPKAYRDFYVQVARGEMRYLNQYKWRLDAKSGRKVSSDLGPKSVLEKRLRLFREVMNDSLLPSLFYQNEFYTVIMSMGGQTRFSPAASFDAVAADSILPPMTRRNMLKQSMQMIEEGIAMLYSATFETKKQYAQRYLDIVGDSVFLKRVLQLDIPVFGKYDIALVSSDGRQTTLQDVVNGRKGKVLYIDFWASWCSPCRAQMPASRKLKEFYGEREVEFIYISLDTDREAWLRACEAERIPAGSSFRAIDVSRSEYYRSLEVLGIPWYVIVDRAGRTVCKNAPRPSTGEAVTAELGKHL